MSWGDSEPARNGDVRVARRAGRTSIRSARAVAAGAAPCLLVNCGPSDLMSSAVNDEEVEVPRDLLEPPTSEYPPPPIEVAEPTLPLRGLTPRNLERLCLRMARLEGEPHSARRYGVEGQKQHGIDIYSRLPNGRYATYQCKRFQELEKADVTAAVDAFRGGAWAERSEKFVLMTSALADRTDVEEEIEEQTTALAKLQPPVVFEVWDEEEVSHRLREHPDIVGLFFGPHWRERFFGENPTLDVTPGEISTIVENAVRNAAAPLLVSNDWAPPRLRPRLDELRVANPNLFRLLTEHFGNPPEAPLVNAATTTPPPWLANADDATWTIVARVAEGLGEWPAAARAWEQVALRGTGLTVVRAYAHGASAAGQAHDTETSSRLLARAEEIDSTDASVVLSRLTEATPPAEQLRVLERLTSDDPELRGLIAARRALAHLLMPDVEAARRDLDDVREAIPGSWLIPGLEVSITVQEARLDKLGQRSLRRGALEAGDVLAKQAREGLLAERRFSEATRLLMLRADIQSLLGDRHRASRILRDALPEDRATQEQREVLADAAASRALDYELALELLHGAAETPVALRIRLECIQEIGTPRERDEALAKLDEIVDSRGDQAAEAAFVRLAATLGAVDIPWSEDAAVFLRSGRHERAAVTAEAMYKLKHEGWPAVARLLQPYGQTPWAQATLLRAALHPSVDAADAADAANRVLALGASHELRVEAARALSRARRFENARDILMAVARDPNAPDIVRADAYYQLMNVVAKELDDWKVAGDLFDEWIKLRPDDSRSYAWAPTVANRRPRP